MADEEKTTDSPKPATTPDPPAKAVPFEGVDQTVPKGAPKTPEERAAMMAAENAAALTSNQADAEEQDARKERAAGMAVENTGVMVPDAYYQETMK